VVSFYPDSVDEIALFIEDIKRTASFIAVTVECMNPDVPLGITLDVIKCRLVFGKLTLPL
jgi:hypothetical protein